MECVKIEGHDNLIRDIDSKAILQTDMGAVARYQRQSKIIADAKNSTKEIQNIKNDIQELKEMFGALLRKLNDTSTPSE